MSYPHEEADPVGVAKKLFDLIEAMTTDPYLRLSALYIIFDKHEYCYPFGQVVQEVRDLLYCMNEDAHTLINAIGDGSMDFYLNPLIPTQN